MLPTCSVYGLYSTKDRVIRYIGQTMQQPIRRRLVQHLAEAARPPCTSRCHRWIRSVLRSGHEIGIELIEADCRWNEAEMRWIAFYRSQSPGLMTNLAAGGGGYSGKRSLATRMKMRKPKSEEHRARMRGRKMSPDHVAKLIQANIGNTKGRGERNGSASLSESQVIEIKRCLQKSEPISRIAARYGISKSAVSKIRTGRTWRHLQETLSDPCEVYG